MSEDATDEEPRIRLGRVIVRGGKIKIAVQDQVVDAVLSWGVTEITQLSMTIVDPDFAIWRSALFELGTPMLYREPGMTELPLRVTSVTTDGGPAGTGGLTIAARSEGVYQLRRRRGKKVMRKASPTDFVKAECKAVGLKVVAQKSPQRAQVARDLPQKGQEDLSGAARPSSWTTFLRLAQELGFYCYEFGGTVYFGKPTWLIEQDDDPLKVAMPLDGAPAKLVAREIPTVSASEDAEVPVEITGLAVGKERLAECRPGAAMKLLGLPPYNDNYLITTMSMPLLGNGPIDLTAATPKNPTPQPPVKAGGASGGYDDGSSGPLQQTGTRSSLDFVNMAISASSAAYDYGAEASPSDATPAALDCSELIQWALARVGVPFVDGSAAQIAACRSITVAEALRTRGALLYMPGHIGISLGDGRSVEARNPSAGVGIFRAADIRWTAGGLVPGLRYG